jgi:hypothetical protein
MKEVTSTLTSDPTEVTNPTVETGGVHRRRTRRWAIWAAVVVVVIGGLWFGLARHSGPTVASTVADCTQSFESGSSSQAATNVQPGVVGLGSVASLASFETPTGEAWCFDGVGTGSGRITNAEMHTALVAPVAVEDGTLTSDVLLLVHLGERTTSVIVTTADAHSTVLARKDGFEVLRIPTTGWPATHWHVPWSRQAVALGRLIGFDNDGRVTANMAFTWCPGAINNSPGTGC